MFRWRKILFDTRPKTNRRDFFDREKEIEELKDVILHRDFAAVLGIRRIGKTSLVKVTLSELPDHIALTINLGRLGSKSSYPMEAFSKLFLEGASELIRKYTFAGKVSKIIANRLGVNPEDVLELNWAKIGIKLRELRTEDVNEIVRALDSIAGDNRKGLVVFLDEVQNVKRVKGFDLGSFFQDVYDWCEHTTVIVSGSFVGVAEEVLNQVEEKKPFYGRKFFRIKLERFDAEKSEEFLRKGFEEEGVKVEEEVIGKAVRLLDGIPGWLALFGRSYSYSLKHSIPIDLKAVVREAARQVAKEFTGFLHSSNSPKRYAEIVLSLSRLGNRGKLSEIRDVMNSLFREDIGDSRLYELLKTLTNYGFVIKTERGEYSLPIDLPSRLGIKHAATMWLKRMP